ncbi:hypothetical protein ABQX22_11350 [Xanthomonas sp. WHRI 1810A]|uniref:hypothetical protein n=1 Tax=Xanthomonas sp. WHRI 1810A TaxID=3161565 RepID=UPI0032E87B56
MNSVLLRDGFSTARTNARQRIEGALDLRRLFRVIDSDPAIVGAGVVFIDRDFNVVTLRDFQPICSFVVKRVILREAPRHMAAHEFVRELETNPRESQMAMEVVNAGLSCVGAFIAWNVVLGAGIATPFTAGATSVIASVAMSAAVASGIQCLNAGARVVLERAAPHVKDSLEGNQWYEGVIAILDGLTLLGAASTALVTVKYVSAIRTSTGKTTTEVLRGLTRQERAKLTAELLALRDPRLTPKILKLRQVTGELPKRYSQRQVRQAVLTQIADVIGAGLAVYSSSNSGNLKTIAIGFYQEG